MVDKTLTDSKTIGEVVKEQLNDPEFIKETMLAVEFDEATQKMGIFARDTLKSIAEFCRDQNYGIHEINSIILTMIHFLIESETASQSRSFRSMLRFVAENGTEFVKDFQKFEDKLDRLRK